LISEADRRAEFTKYDVAYQDTGYRPDKRRLGMQAGFIAEAPSRDGYLDIGTGHGDMLDRAENLGFSPIIGTEVVSSLLNDRVIRAEAHQLPFEDDSFDVSSAFEVIEHLLPDDDKAMCLELSRVTRRRVIIGANNGASFASDGSDLHPNRRSFEEWDDLFRDWFLGWHVEMLEDRPLKHTRVWRMSR
jgi:hypothetical protein